MPSWSTMKTELSIEVKGPDGEAVQISSAEVFLAAWGVADEVTLSTQANSFSVDLSSSARPSWAGHFDDFRAYIYVAASGYASIRSEPFDWLYPPEASTSVIDFRDGRSVTMHEGEHRVLQLALRRPVPRSLHFVDDSNLPVPHVRISAGIFWSDSNHCGFLSGVVPLLSSATDENGMLSVPDADSNYVLELLHDPMSFVDAEEQFPKWIIRRLGSNETIRLHRSAKQRLSVTFERDHQPITGLTLMGHGSPCGCGVCSGPIGTSDSSGRIIDDRFYPEAFDALWVCDGDIEVKSIPLDSLKGKAITIQVPSRSKAKSGSNNRCSQ